MLKSCYWIALPIFTLAIFGISGCASIDQQLVSNQKKQTIEDAQQHQLYIPEYPDQVQPGDILLTQREDETLGVEYRVGEAGVFYYPYVGEVKATGKTPGEISAAITDALKETLRQPDVTVNISAHSNNQVFIGGEVRNNGVYEVKGNLSVMQAIFMAGGFTDVAEKQQIALMRLTPDQHYDIYIFDFDSVIDIERNQRRALRLLRGDIIFVPKTRIGNALQFVDQYIRRLLPFQMSVGAFYELNRNYQ